MLINTSVAEHYFKNKTVEDIKDHWIFNSIENNKCLCENPSEENYERLKRIQGLLVEALENFKPWNIEIWEEFFGPYNCKDNNIIVYITVGIPYPYDAMVREDNKGEVCVILDLERIRFYSEDDKKVIEIIEGLITHEMAHVYIHKSYNWPSFDSKIDKLLKYITFNEGIAHFLALKDNVLDMDWNSEEMEAKKKRVYKTLLSHISADEDEKKEEILLKSNSGKYWEKFAAISGMFAVVDYHNLHNKDIKAFGELYEKGVDELFSVILK